MRRPILLAAVLCSAALLAQSPDALHYKLEIDLDFVTQTIQGTNSATFASRSNGLTTVSLDLLSQLVVSSVQMGGVPVAWSRPTDRIDITLDRPYNLGESFTVQVSYGGTPPVPAGFGGLQFTTTAGNRPVAWTLSEPWDARGWWPGQDQLNDKATWEMWVTHPSNMSSASNGLLQGVDVLPNNRVRSRWQTNYPMAAYLASFVVTEFSRRTDWYTGFGANMPVEFFVFPESFASWTSGMNLVVPMLNAFSGAYGQYPFVNEKYGIVQFTWGGGMEHQTITSQVNVSESITAHELSHQWWGDMTTCETWSDVWLNEGFATFSEALWLERKAGGTLASYLAAMVARKPSTTSGTVYVYTPTNVNNIFSTTNVYRKGAWALHMLRGVLGDAAFFQAMHDYRASYEGDSATTAEFRAAAEQSSGRELGWFFDEWVMAGGSPAYQYAWQTKNVGGSNYLYLEIDQSQTSQSVFTMPVKLRVTTSAGVVDATVWNDERQDQMVVALPAPASAVALDPDQWILRGTPTTRGYTAPFFGVDHEEIDTVNGGRVEFHLDLGAASANRPFALVIGMSGSNPAWNLFGLSIPVARDLWTDVSLQSANSVYFQNFLGYLDANGLSRSVLDVPAGIATVLAGMTITASAIRIDAFDFASRPVTVQLK
jgi:aminopeptidase N